MKSSKEGTKNHMTKPITLLIAVFLLTAPAQADVIRTLVATGGTLSARQDASMGGVFGVDFNIGGITSTRGSATPTTLTLTAFDSAEQLSNQSTPFRLEAPSAGIDGHLCCIMSGILQITALPVVPIVQERVYTVISPFTISGTLQGGGDTYGFQGAGIMTSIFTRNCTGSYCIWWDSTRLDFGPALDLLTTSVPEPSTWLLLLSGLLALAWGRWQRQRQVTHFATTGISR